MMIGSKFFLVEAVHWEVAGRVTLLHSTLITADCSALDLVNKMWAEAGLQKTKSHWRAALRELREIEPGADVSVTPLLLLR